MSSREAKKSFSGQIADAERAYALAIKQDFKERFEPRADELLNKLDKLKAEEQNQIFSLEDAVAIKKLFEWKLGDAMPNVTNVENPFAAKAEQIKTAEAELERKVLEILKKKIQSQILET